MITARALVHQSLVIINQTCLNGVNNSGRYKRYCVEVEHKEDDVPLPALAG